MRYLPVLFGALFCLASTGKASAQGQVTHGSQSPAIGQMRGVINYNITYPASSKLNSLDAKREALLMAENPTVLEIGSVRWNEWFGDPQPFLDVVLVNKSRLPALDVQVELLNLESAGTLAKLKPHVVAKSYTMRILEGTPVTVAPGATSSLPFASLADIRKLITNDCITSAGLDFPSPVRTFDGSSAQGRASSRHTGMYLRVRYRTIFKEKISYFRSIVIDSADRSNVLGSERDTGRLVPLVCVGDPDWNSTSS